MCKLITASIATFCLFVLAATGHAQTTNVNRVNGNGNTVINSSTSRSTVAPQRVVRIINGVECVEYVQPAYYAPTYAAPASYHTYHHGVSQVSSGRSPAVNLNINAINGNGNRVVNGTTGGRGGANININAINGNGNRVVNSSTGGRTTNVNAINGNRNTVVNRNRP